MPLRFNHLNWSYSFRKGAEFSVTYNRKSHTWPAIYLLPSLPLGLLNLGAWVAPLRHSRNPFCGQMGLLTDTHIHNYIHTYVICVSHTAVNSFHQVLIETPNPENVEKHSPPSCLPLCLEWPLWPLPRPPPPVS